MRTLLPKQKSRLSYSFIWVITAGLIRILSSCDSFKTQATAEKIPAQQEDSLTVVRLIVAGDAIAHAPQITQAKNPQTNEYDFSGCFQYIEDILKEGDLNIVNLETTLAGAPYSGYPQFCAPDEFALALHEAGFHFFLLANNHSADRGTKGVKQTIEKLRDMKIPAAGTYLDEQDRNARYPAIIEVDGIKIALLNYTYATNGLTVTPPVSINHLDDTLQIEDDIKAARGRHADIIIAFLHWGTEYRPYPDEKQKEQATFFFRHGVDVIIGSHPHVVQPVEHFAYDEADTTKKKLVYWSLGNLISNQRKEHTDGGILASFSIIKNKNTQSVSVGSYETILYWVYKNMAIYPGYFVLPIDRFPDDTTTFTLSPEDKLTLDKFTRNTQKIVEKK
jgi:poly-gamma-glutamate synthesis protein (capsule biosynthesis protein)